MIDVMLAITGVLMVVLFVLVFWLNDPTVDTDWKKGPPMNQAWLAAHRKAIGAFLTVLVTQLTALLALGILSGPISHDIAVGLTVAAPVLAFFGVKYTAPNVPQA